VDLVPRDDIERQRQQAVAGEDRGGVIRLLVQGGTTAADAIFTVYDATGTAITLPIDFDNNAQTLASINSLKIKLSVQSANKDFTGGYPVTTVVSSMALMNSCSEALLNGYTPPFCE